MRIFGANISLAHAAGSARRRLKTTASYNADSAVEFTWEHECSPSSRDATASLSLLRTGGILQNFYPVTTASKPVVRALSAIRLSYCYRLTAHAHAHAECDTVIG